MKARTTARDARREAEKAGFNGEALENAVIPSTMIDIDDGIAQILVAPLSSPDAVEAAFAAAEAQLLGEGRWEIIDFGRPTEGPWAYWARYRDQ